MKRAFQAIVVGIEDYDNATWKKLAGVRDTAMRVARSLGTEPIVLSDGGTKSETPQIIGDAIDAIPERATLLLHWIGHGVTAGDQHYLVYRDSPEAGKLTGLKAFPSGELGRILATSNAERVVVVLDTCFSGEGGGDFAGRYYATLKSELKREGWERVACVIASSHALDKAVAGRFSQGLAEVLEDPERHQRWGRGQQYVDPEQLMIAVRDVLGETNKAIEPEFLKIGYGQDIIPNPLYKPQEGNTDLETRRWLEGVFGGQAHFSLAARGIETGKPDTSSPAASTARPRSSSG